MPPKKKVVVIERVKYARGHEENNVEEYLRPVPAPPRDRRGALAESVAAQARFAASEAVSKAAAAVLAVFKKEAEAKEIAEDARRAQEAVRRATVDERRRLLVDLSEDLPSEDDDESEDRMDFVLELAAMLRRALDRRTMSLLTGRVLGNWRRVVDMRKRARAFERRRRLATTRNILTAWRGLVDKDRQFRLLEQRRIASLASAGLAAWYSRTQRRRSMTEDLSPVWVVNARRAFRRWQSQATTRIRWRRGREITTTRCALLRWQRWIRGQHLQRAVLQKLLVKRAWRSLVRNTIVGRIVALRDRGKKRTVLRRWKKLTGANLLGKRLRQILRHSLMEAWVAWRFVSRRVGEDRAMNNKAIAVFFKNLNRRYFRKWITYQKRTRIHRRWHSLFDIALFNAKKVDTRLRRQRAEQERDRRDRIEQWAVQREERHRAVLLRRIFTSWKERYDAVKSGIVTLGRVDAAFMSRSKARGFRRWLLHATLQPLDLKIADRETKLQDEITASKHLVARSVAELAATKRQRDLSRQECESLAKELASTKDVARHREEIDAAALKRNEETDRVEAEQSGKAVAVALQALQALESDIHAKKRLTTLSKDHVAALRAEPRTCAATGFDRRRLRWLRTAVQDIKARTLLRLTAKLADLSKTPIDDDDKNFANALKEAKRLRQQLALTHGRIAVHLKERDLLRRGVRGDSASPRGRADVSRRGSGSHHRVVRKLRSHTARLVADIAAKKRVTSRTAAVLASITNTSRDPQRPSPSSTTTSDLSRSSRSTRSSALV